MADSNKNDPQALIDLITFYSALFYKLAATNKYGKEDFQKLISNTYENLPVRGGGLGKGGFWENICAIHNIQIHATDDDLAERVIKNLADAIWLPYDQELKNAKL